MRYVMISLLTVVILGGCSAKEFNQGVSEGFDDVKRVIRGTNN
ncbi:hypothetical protein [Sulfuricurvum sp.]|nr:hypothetical protein [Sulfuricurvum sp.]